MSRTHNTFQKREKEHIMEIEKKYRVKYLPEGLEQYEKKEIEQGYLASSPIVRIRKSNNDYILTYKSKFGIDESKSNGAKVCNEVELPLTESAYEHLKEKVDNRLVRKSRYIIPLDQGYKAELDIFYDHLEGLTIVEVEFPDMESIETFQAPEWFGEDVSKDKRFSNNKLSAMERWVEE